MRSTLSIRTYITVMVVVTVLPILVFSGLLVHRAASDEQELMTRAMRDTARAVAGDLNRQIGGLLSLAVTIADARMLQIDDVSAFYVRWSHVVEREGLTAVLYDPAGRQLVNTAQPSGTHLPAEPDMVARVAALHDVDISDLPPDGASGGHVVSINVPVRRDGKLIYVLSLRITGAIAAAMAQQVLPPQQVAALIGRDGAVITSTHEPGPPIGARPPPDFPQAIRDREEGAWFTHAADGTPVYVAFHQVKSTGWVLAVSTPSEVLFAPATHSLRRLLMLGAGTLLLVGFLAWIIGRGIANSVSGLSRLATTPALVQSGDAPPSTHIREVNAVIAAILEAAETSRRQTDQRERATDALKAEVAGRQRIEQQLIQSQKMEAVGQLTGGMAHDFNNLLSIVVGSLDLLRERWANDPTSLVLAEEAMKAALHGAELTRQMLAFARRQPLVPERCDINDVISEFARLLTRTLGEDIVIDLSLAGDLWPVLVDRVQLEAAITNLATNARQAMPRGGRLTIATRNTTLDEDNTAAHPDVAPGDYASIEVCDTGTGMPPDVLTHIFEPFFTTKEPGKGTGLGLSMVFGFLKQSGGHISVYSEVGQGTTFRLYLPPLKDAASPDEPAPPPARAPDRGLGEIILAVEDNAGLRRVLVHQLIDAGYQVVEADNAQAALDRINGEDPIDLLLTDIVMPGSMNGRELARLAAVLRPDMKVLLTSGFSETAAEGPVTPPGIHTLRKPYRREELLRVVHETLHAA